MIDSFVEWQGEKQEILSIIGRHKISLQAVTEKAVLWRNCSDDSSLHAGYMK